MLTESQRDYLTIGTQGKVRGWYYTPDGFMVPSVTEVLGILAPELSGWAAGIASKAVYKAAQSEGLYCRSTKTGITQAMSERLGREAVEATRAAAADIGSEFHACAWRVVSPEGYPPSSHGKEVEQALDNLRQWYADVGPERVRVEATETTVYGDGYAGTADGIVSIDGSAGLIELKTSRELRPSYAMQAAAYRAAWNREGRRPRLTWAAVLRVDKRGAGYDFAIVEQRRALAAFKAALKTYFALRGRVYEF